jgi:Ni,Fe-hydrogenase III small subunit
MRHARWNAFIDARPHEVSRIISEACDGCDLEVFDLICAEAARGTRWAVVVVESINRSVDASIDLNPLPTFGNERRRIA